MGKYKVTGSAPVLGHSPGDVFEAELPEAQEKRLLDRGAISKSQAKASDEKAEEDSAQNEEE